MQRLARVMRHVDADVGQVEGVGVLRVDVDVAVIEVALRDVLAEAHQPPGLAAVVGAEEAARLALVGGLHQGVHHVGLARRHRQADLAEDAGRQPRVVRDVGPVRAAVGRLEDAAAGPAAREAPVLVATPATSRRTPPAGWTDPSPASIAPVAVVDEQHLLPGLAAVGGLVDPALRVRSPQMAEGGGVDDIRVPGVHDDPADDVGRAQADEAPGLAAVGGLVHPLAGHFRVAGRVVARADVDDPRIGGRNRHRADIAGLEILVGNILPAVAVVGGFPDAAARRAHEEFIRLGGDAGHGGDPSAGIGPHAAPPQRRGRPARRRLRRPGHRQDQTQTERRQHPLRS